MDKLKKLQNNLTTYSFFWILITSLLSVGIYIVTSSTLKYGRNLALIITTTVSLTTSYFISKLIVLAGTQPLKAVWQAIWHISPNGKNVPAPNISAMTHGKDLADSIVREIYDLASNSSSAPQLFTSSDANKAQPPLAPSSATTNNSLLNELIPIIAMDGEGTVIMANKLFCDYVQIESNELIGKSLNNVLQIKLPGNETLQAWSEATKTTKITADKTWDHVKLELPEKKVTKRFDMIGHYSRGSQSGYEVLLAIFDHTEKYSLEDGSSSYVALAVHELRTPLTVLRGYIEVLQDELEGKLTPELQDFMGKMGASAQTLSAFVSNILNVARVDENQLTLSMHEANWNEVLPEICKNLELRAKVRGKTLVLDIAPNLPTVAVNKVSIQEVVSNLVENAIKYSGDGKKIIIQAAVGREGNVETAIQDFGAGIPEAAVKHLFTKFYRSHRSKSMVGGSGLGLYLVKAIVTAHGGNVWVNSAEGEGSSFGFSLKPYSKLAEGQKRPSTGIELHAHGWVKHSSADQKSGVI